MAVSTDTIQMLLRQRQELREALLDLRQEIATLDATSLDLVNRNIKNQTEAKAAPAPTPAPAPVAVPAREPAAPPPKPVADPAPPKAEHPQPAPAPKPASVAPVPAPAATPEPVAPAAPAAEPAAVRQEPRLAAAPAGEAETAPAPAPDHATKPADGEGTGKNHKEKGATKAAPPPAPAPETDFAPLLARAKAVSAYYLDHPAASTPAELGALDAAILVSGTATTPAEKTACYHTLQAAYRKVSSESDARFGINGTTLTDSRVGARLLWAIPLCITLLIIVVFPLLLFGRTMVDQMFTVDFATDLTWTLGIVAAFLWGAVGALTLLTLDIAHRIRRRQYEAAVRRSPGLRGTLGGLVGALFFMILEVWLPDGNVTAEFALDLTAFLGGLLSAVLFACLQRVFGAVTIRIEPVPKPGPANAADKK